MASRHAHDSGDNAKNACLIQRLSNVNSSLSNLKRQLNSEKFLLEQRKREMNRKEWSIPEHKYEGFSNGCGPSADVCRPSTSPIIKESTVTLNKQHLKEIQKRCGQELEKLNEFIFSVNEFKSYWIQLREAEKSKSRPPECLEKTEYTENTFFEKKYPKSKIFYVDSDLY